MFLGFEIVDTRYLQLLYWLTAVLYLPTVLYFSNAGLYGNKSMLFA